MRDQTAVDIVAQDLRRPDGEHVLGSKVGIRGLRIGPLLAPLGGKARRRKPLAQRCIARQAHQQGAPARHHGRIEQYHAAHQVGPLLGHHHAEHAAQRMADEDHGRAVAALQVIDILAHQLGPARADGIIRVVRMHVERLHAVVLAKQAEQLAVGACRIAVGMGKVQLRECHRGMVPVNAIGNCNGMPASRIRGRPLIAGALAPCPARTRPAPRPARRLIPPRKRRRQMRGDGSCGCAR